MLNTFLEAAEALFSRLLAYSRRFFSLAEEEIATGGRRVTKDGEEHRYSAKAVKELRERGKGGNFEGQRKLAMDLTLAMLLALGIVTFDLLNSRLHAYPICRYNYPRHG